MTFSQSESQSESELELELESELESEVEAEVELEELELEDAYTKKRGCHWHHAKKRGRRWRHAPVDPSLFISENGVYQLSPFPKPPPQFLGALLTPPPPPEVKTRHALAWQRKGVVEGATNQAVPQQKLGN